MRNEKDNPPCNTLFIGNLGPAVDEAELRALFGPLPGFQQSKVVHGPRGVTAFVEFADVSAAAACHAAQQGALLATSDRGPIRVQFSKNPFGRKRADLAGGPSAELVHVFAGGGGGGPGGGYFGHGGVYAPPLGYPGAPAAGAVPLAGGVPPHGGGYLVPVAPAAPHTGEHRGG